MKDSEDDGKITDEMERMRAQAPSWNLAADNSLLQLLENMHENMIAKAKQTNTKMDGLLSQLNDADVYLNNVNNRFMALSNTQFVENRVYDDDIEVIPVQNKNDLKNEIIPKGTGIDTLKEQDNIDRQELDLCATASALVTLESYHEKIHIVPDSDSDSDDGSGTEMYMTDSLVLRPRDLYERLPLPHIIGSEQWKAKSHVGLIEEDSTSESGDDRKSTIRQSEDATEYSSEDETYDPVEPICTASEIAEFKATYKSDSDDMTSDSEQNQSMNVASQREENTSETYIETQSTATAAKFAAELAKRLGAPLPPKSELRVPQLPQSSPTSKDHKLPVNSNSDRQKTRVTGNIFPDEPPPLDQPMDEDLSSDTQDEDIFSSLSKPSKPTFAKNTNNLFKNSSVIGNTYGGLFDDIEPPANLSSSVYTPNSVDLFDEFEPKSSLMEKKEKKKESNADNISKSRGRILFDSDSDSGDIFAETPKRNEDLPKTAFQKDVREHKGSLFDDDSDTGDLFSTKSIKKPFSKVINDRIHGDTPQSEDLFTNIDNDRSTMLTKECDVYENKDTKKPRGGVSLFQGNETKIAAAILKRTQKKSSSSDSSDTETILKIDKTVSQHSRQTKADPNIHTEVSNISKVEADSIFKDSKINEIYHPKNNGQDLFSNDDKNTNEIDGISKTPKDIKDNKLFSKDTNDFDDLFPSEIEDDKNNRLFSKKSKDLEDANIFSKDNNPFSKETKDIDDNNLFSKEPKVIKDDSLFSNDTKDDNKHKKIYNSFSNESMLEKMRDNNLFSNESNDMVDNSLFSKDPKNIDDNSLFSKDTKDDNLSNSKLVRDKEDSKKESKTDSSSKNLKDGKTHLSSITLKGNKPEIKTKPTVLKPDNAIKAEKNNIISNKSNEETNKIQTVIDEKNAQAIPTILHHEFVPVISKSEFNKDVSPSLFSDDASPIPKDDFADIFHSEPPEFEPDEIKTNHSLFYDDEDDSDDIFSNNSGFKTVPPKDNLFGDDKMLDGPKRNIAIFDDEPPDFDNAFNSASIFDKNETKSTKTDIKSVHSTENHLKQGKKSLESSIDSITNYKQQSTNVLGPKEALSTDDIFNSTTMKTDLINNLDNVFIDSNNMFQNAEIKANANTGDSIFGKSCDEKDDLFSTSPKSSKAGKKTLFQNDNNDDIFPTSPRTIDSLTVDKKNDKLLSSNKTESENTSKSVESTYETVFVTKCENDKDKLVFVEKTESENTFKPVDIRFEPDPVTKRNDVIDDTENVHGGTKMKESPTRVIGKLKPSTLNINVNSLKPGVIPKFSNKSVESSDDSKLNREEHGGRIVKSVSFDESTNPSVLTNIAKDRPKIQVKRKPSTRKGRQDALRNSTVDLNSDKESPTSKDSVDSYVYSLPTSPHEAKPLEDSLRSVGLHSGHIHHRIHNITDEKSYIIEQKPVQQNITIEEPNISCITSVKPNIISNKPNSTKDKPAISNEHPNNTKSNLSVTSEKLHVNDAKPNVIDDELAQSNKKPNIIDDKLAKTNEKPHISTNKPIITSDIPNISTDKPVTANEKPNITYQNPIINDKPEKSDISTSIKTKGIPKSMIHDKEPDFTCDNFLSVNTLGQTYNDEIGNESSKKLKDPSKTDNILNTQSSHLAKTSSSDLFNELFVPVLSEKSGNMNISNMAAATKEFTVQSGSKMSVTKTNLFIDSQNSDEELFSSNKTNVIIKKNSLLFADDFDEEDLFGAKTTQRSATKNLTQPQENFKTIAESHKKDLIQQDKETNSEIKLKKNDVMFLDSDTEDLFATKFEKVKIKPKTEKSVKAVSDDLFSSEEKSVFSKERTKSLFADDDDDSDIFGTKKKQESSSKSTSKTQEEPNEKLQQNTLKIQSVPSSAEQVFKDPLSFFDND